MELPTREEVLQMAEEFGNETYPPLIAIIAMGFYSGFVFMFYRVLAKKDLITLDLSKYADDFGGKIKKYLRSMLFVIQYIVLIPILIAFWTLVLAAILTLLSNSDDHARNALIATAVVGAVRILSYWTEDLSRDVAKMLPFAVLGVFLVDSTSVKWSEFQELLSSLPQLATSFLSSLILLAILETLLRIVTTIRRIRSKRWKRKRMQKELSRKTGRRVNDIKEDIRHDGSLNLSAGADVEEMQSVVEEAVGDLLDEPEEELEGS